jgi:hypothetical protein
MISYSAPVSPIPAQSIHFRADCLNKFKQYSQLIDKLTEPNDIYAIVFELHLQHEQCFILWRVITIYPLLIVSPCFYCRGSSSC